jgi:hypothetical protein
MHADVDPDLDGAQEVARNYAQIGEYVSGSP